MCGRFGLGLTEPEILLELPGYRFAPGVAWSPRFNIAPTQAVLAVRNDGLHEISTLRWGLVPSWAADPSHGSRMINARAETVATSPAYRAALRRRRAVILMTHFYEWRKNARGTKTPLLVRARDQRLAGFAGLYEFWRPLQARDEQEALATCTIVTCAANRLVAGIHDRKPVILPRAAWAEWLEPSEVTAEAVLPLLQPYASENSEAFAISPRLNDVRNEGADLVTPVA